MSVMSLASIVLIRVGYVLVYGALCIVCDGIIM